MSDNLHYLIKLNFDKYASEQEYTDGIKNPSFLNKIKGLQRSSYKGIHKNIIDPWQQSRAYISHGNGLIPATIRTTNRAGSSLARLIHNIGQSKLITPPDEVINSTTRREEILRKLKDIPSAHTKSKAQRIAEEKRNKILDTIKIQDYEKD